MQNSSAYGKRLIKRRLLRYIWTMICNYSACPVLISMCFIGMQYIKNVFAITLQKMCHIFTKVKIIGYPKMDISHWDAAIHYGVQLAQYCDQTRSCNVILRRSPPVCSLALRLRNTKVPVWTLESIGYPKMDISHWDAAIHYGSQQSGRLPKVVALFLLQTLVAI